MELKPKALRTDKIVLLVISMSAKTHIVRRKVVLPFCLRKKSRKENGGNKIVLWSRCMEIGCDDDDLIFPTSEVLKGRLSKFSAD